MLTILLLGMVTPIVYTQSSVEPAASTTVTSFETVTTTVTQTLVSSSAVATNVQTFTTTDTLFSESVHIDGPGDGLCNIVTYKFSGAKDQHVGVQLQSPIAFYFFILTEDSYQKWTQQRYCEVKTPTLVTQKEIKTYSTDVALPSSGDYRFMFELWDINDSADIQFTASIYPIVDTSTSTIYSESTQTSISTYTSSRSTILVSQVQEPLSLGGSLLWVVILIALVAVGGAFAAYRMRSGKKGKAGTRVGTGSGKFCVTCGAELVPSSKFCRKCGEPAP